MQIKRITSEDLGREELKFYSERSEVQLRRCNEPAPGCFVAESLRVIERALDAGYEPISLLIEDRHLEEAVVRRCTDIPIYLGSAEVLSSLAGYKLTGGALSLMKRKPDAERNEVLDKAKRLVVLEGVNNPTNVGAIFRSAAALGAEGILLTPDCSDPLYRRSARVSMGTVVALPWAYFGADRGSDVTALKHAGYMTIAMALSKNAISLADVSGVLVKAENADKIAVFLGNENDGLSEETIKACDHTVIIPMQSGVDSLNVAAASAVVFWELFGRKKA